MHGAPNVSLVMVDNLEFVGSDAPFDFRFVLKEPLSRVGSVQLVGMSMDYNHYAVHVAIDELDAEFPVFVDKALDSPMLLAPEVVYKRSFEGEPLARLAHLSIKLTGYDGKPLLGPVSRGTDRVSLLFVVEHDCPGVAPMSDAQCTLVLVSNLHTARHEPYTFTWPGPLHGPIRNVRRVALKAMVMSMFATDEPYVRLSIPELHIADWPVPYTCDIVGSYYPFVLMHRSDNHKVEFYPPKCSLGALDIKVTDGNGKALGWQQPQQTRKEQYMWFHPKGGLIRDLGNDGFVFMLLEVDSQAAPPGTLEQHYMPRPAGSRLVFVDSNNYALRHVLDEPCTNVSRLVLQQLACPHVAAQDVLFARLSIRNLGIGWVVPYGAWLHEPLTNVLKTDEALHTAWLAPPCSFGHLDIELEWLDPASGAFRPFVPHPDAVSATMCFTLKAD
ncbi:hypothetical protein COO60DRAFT_1643822 [Scenedesmus sp. NREL 46B-D3]|nr:hypothetical protein COO60DRAFT_1643822 [Scenedesmus sp. NREL 46B-D3]